MEVNININGESDKFDDTFERSELVERCAELETQRDNFQRRAIEVEEARDSCRQYFANVLYRERLAFEILEDLYRMRVL